jgi:hypothetical protein
MDETNELLSEMSELREVALRSQELQEQVLSLEKQVDYYRRLSFTRQAGESEHKAGESEHSDGAASASPKPAWVAAHLNVRDFGQAERGCASSSSPMCKPIPIAQHWLLAFPSSAGDLALPASSGICDAMLAEKVSSKLRVNTPRASPPAAMSRVSQAVSSDNGSPEGCSGSNALERKNGMPHWEQMSQELALSHLRNQSKHQLSNAIQQLQQELVSRESRVRELSSPALPPDTDVVACLAQVSVPKSPLYIVIAAIQQVY